MSRVPEWVRRARAGTLPPAVVNGTPRTLYRCPAEPCDFANADVEATWAHMWAKHLDRRRTKEGHRMKRLLVVALLALLVGGCSGGQSVDGGPGIGQSFRYFHDAQHGVSCWAFGTSSSGISCLPDKEVVLP